MYLYQAVDPGPGICGGLLNLKFDHFRTSVLYDSDSPCIYLSVFAQHNRIALSDGSFQEIKLNIVP